MQLREPYRGLCFACVLLPGLIVSCDPPQTVNQRYSQSFAVVLANR